jgi:hypothetical protein
MGAVLRVVVEDVHSVCRRAVNRNRKRHLAADPEAALGSPWLLW